MLETPKSTEGLSGDTVGDVTMGNQQERLLSLAYIAGFFDGEGSVYIHRLNKSTGPRLTPRACFSQKNHWILQMIADTLKFYGIGVYLTRNMGQGNANNMQVSGVKRVKKFAELMLPFVVLKHDELQVLLDYCNARLATPNRSGYNDSDFDCTAKIRAIREKRYSESSETSRSSPIGDDKVRTAIESSRAAVLAVAAA